jgi:type I restriction enzyme S subunit
MGDWSTVPLTDVLAFREGPGIMAADFRETGVPLIRLAGLKRGAGILRGANYLDAEAVETRWKQFRVESGDVLLSTSASLGEVAVVTDDAIGAVPYTGIIRFRPRDERVAPEFIQHMLTTESFRRQIEAMGVGSVMRHFGPSHLRQMSVSFPSVREQRAIAEVLGALDDKIAANDTLLRVSDGLVRAIFASVGEGAGEEVELSTLAESMRMQVDPAEVDPSMPYVGLEHVPRRSMWMSDSGVAADVSSAKARFLRGDVLFGKLRPYFHKVVRADRDGIASTDILVIRAKNPSLAGFVLAAASSDRAIRATSAAVEGTRMPRTKWADLASVTVSWPGDAAAMELSSQVAVFAAQAEALQRETRTLRHTRDALLPLLMSGKVRVRDAENRVEGVL